MEKKIKIDVITLHAVQNYCKKAVSKAKRKAISKDAFD